jgi:pimeloyl-ACP methyl ester carboxylesterase
MVVVAGPDIASARELGRLQFSPCTLSNPASADAVEAQCTTLSVPENRDAPEGRHIDLAIAWVPAREDAVPDPVFMLAGGPGQSARDSYPGIARAFAEVGKRHHIILVDQRGTGDSNRLICTNAAGESAVMEEGEESPDAARAFAVRCRDRLAAKADLRFYSTTDAIQDLDAVREAIAAPQLNLVGISYGTRVAQQYAARYPQRTRSVVLDSPAPNELMLGSDHARNLEASLDLQFARCTALPACAERFGDPRQQLRDLLAQVRKDPPLVSYRDPITGDWREDRFDEASLVTLVRLFAYAPIAAAMLPLTLHDAANGHPESLVALSRLFGSQLSDQIMHGMQLSVMCTEDVDGLIARPEDADSLLGTAMSDLLKAQCAVWPHNKAPTEFHTPFHSDLPVLVLAGEFDPVTPPRYGEQIVAGLSHGRLLVLRGQGHNVISVGCMPKLLARYIETADAAGLDAGCLDSLPYAPPFAGYYGWEP